MRMTTKMLLTAVLVTMAFTSVASAVPIGKVEAGIFQHVRTVVQFGREFGKAELVGGVRTTFLTRGHTDTVTYNYSIALTNDLSTGMELIIGGGMRSSSIDITVEDSVITIALRPGNSGFPIGAFWQIDFPRGHLPSGTGNVTVLVGNRPTQNLTLGATNLEVLNVTKLPFEHGSSSNALVLSSGVTLVATGSCTIEEGFASAFGNEDQEEGGGNEVSATQGYQLRVTVSPALEAGLALVVSKGGGTDGTLDVSIDGGATGTLVGAKTTVVVEITESDEGDKEDLQLVFTVLAGTGPFTPGDYSITITSFPLGTESPVSQARPRFNVNELPNGGKVVLTIVSATTSALTLFASLVPSLGFDTAVGLANASQDAAVFENGGNAVPNEGPCRLYMYQTGAGGAVTLPPLVFDSSVSPTVGSGWDATGNIDAGGTVSILLSEAWAAAGGTGDFTGHVYIVCDFTHGHFTAFVTNFDFFTQGIPVRIIRDPQIISRTSGIPLGGEVLAGE